MNQDSDQHEAFYADAVEYFSALERDMANAHRSLWLEYYMFRCDSLGKRIINQLAAAVSRGLDVRVIIDGVGSSDDFEFLLGELERHNIPHQVYHPLPWMLKGYDKSSHHGSFPERALHFIRRINNRDHRKLCIIDNQILWTGSFNISARHLPHEAGGENWQDYGLRLSDARVQEIAETFLLLWKRKQRHIRLNSFRRVISNISPRNRYRKNLFLCRQIARAKRRIWICNAYFAPSASIVNRLVEAAQRGLDVCILLPAESDISFFPLLTNSYYPILQNSGARIMEYQQGFLHAKSLIIDDLYILGSSNLNSRSLLHDYELDIVLLEDGSRLALEAQFRKDQSNALLIEANQKKLSLWQHMVARFIKLFSYWM